MSPVTYPSCKTAHACHMDRLLTQQARALVASACVLSTLSWGPHIPPTLSPVYHAAVRGSRRVLTMPISTFVRVVFAGYVHRRSSMLIAFPFFTPAVQLSWCINISTAHHLPYTIGFSPFLGQKSSRILSDEE